MVRKRYATGLALAVALTAATAGPSLAATASGARLGQRGEGITRFVTDLSERVSFQVTTQNNPHRILIEVPDLDWRGPPRLSQPHGAINEIRGSSGRITIDLRKPVAVKSSFLIPPRDGMGWRLVVDLDESAAPPPRTARPAPSPQPPRPATPPSPAVAHRDLPPPPPRPIDSPSAEKPLAAAETPRAEPARADAGHPPEVQSAVLTPTPGAALRPRDGGLPVIVIDPGHGGIDPGAIGVSGIYEKHITLAIARELKAAIERSGRYQVYLTRDRDVFIRLRDRVSIARQYGADLFISLHADAVQNPSIRGLSIYTLSQNASDAESQTLAEKENKADLIAGVDLSHESADVAGILIDLAQRETMNRSAAFAAEAVDEVGHEFSLLDNTHRFAGFAVLKAPDVPAVLIEMGYLSNESEEKQLRQPAYRTRLAKSIAHAVDRFFPATQKAKR